MKSPPAFRCCSSLWLRSVRLTRVHSSRDCVVTSVRPSAHVGGLSCPRWVCKQELKVCCSQLKQQPDACVRACARSQLHSSLMHGLNTCLSCYLTAAITASVFSVVSSLCVWRPQGGAGTGWLAPAFGLEDFPPPKYAGWDSGTTARLTGFHWSQRVNVALRAPLAHLRNTHCFYFGRSTSEQPGMVRRVRDRKSGAERK